LGDEGLLVDDGFDLRERTRVLFALVRHEIMRNDEADQELAGKGDANPRSGTRLGMRCTKPVVDDLIEGAGQGDPHDARAALVCGTVRVERRLAVEAGGRHGEIQCTAGKRGKAAGANR